MPNWVIKYHRSHLLGERETTIDEVPLNVDECFTQKNDQTQMAKTLATEWQEVKGESYKSTANQCFGRDQRKKYNIHIPRYHIPNYERYFL